VIGAVWPEAVGDGVSEQAIDALVRRLRDRIAEIDPVQIIETISNPHQPELLAMAIQGKGAFRRFKDTIARYPEAEQR
jgi:hypothetical protein